jgi:hypothetical protein
MRYADEQLVMTAPRTLMHTVSEGGNSDGALLSGGLPTRTLIYRYHACAHNCLHTTTEQSMQLPCNAVTVSSE